MSSIFPAYAQVHPSFMEPDILLQYNQVSGFVELLAGRKPRVKIDTEDQYIYIKGLRMRSSVETGQATGNNLPQASIAPYQISIPTYFIRCRTEYDFHDQAASARWGVPLTPALRLAGRQAIFQQMRNLCLYGRLPSNGEGILNTIGAVAVALPPDTNGNDTISSYDNGQMSVFLLSIVANMKTTAFQMGAPSRVCVLGPQRVLQQWAYFGIVQLTQFQRAGAGSTTTAGVVKDILLSNGDMIDFAYDDTLKGKGGNGTNADIDAIIFTIPEIVKPTTPGINTNAFAQVEPGLDATVLQYMDMAAPVEITMPLAGGATDTLFEIKASPGWGIRPELVTILSAAYQ
jgi:hypothetical protein